MALHWQVIIALVLGVIYAVSVVYYADVNDTKAGVQFTADYIAPFVGDFCKSTQAHSCSYGPFFNHSRDR